MALTAVMTTLAACSQDDELMDAAPKATPIEFEITDGGYGGDEATRAKEEGLRTKFEDGDECGLYIIDNGEFIASNVKLTAEEGENGEITWKAADGAISGVTENSKYFLYYPYNENDRKVQLGDNDKTVFQNDIEEWRLSWYQNTHVQYARGDLMTATGTASTGADGKLKVSFSLTHQMALAVIELPKTVYKFINEDVTIPDYTVALSADFSSSNYRPLRMEDGTYRFVFNPLRVEYGIIGIVNGNKKFTISADKLKGIKKGTYKTFRIGGANATEEKEHTLQVGDYLMKDGNLVGKDDLSESQKADVAAIVFWAGDATAKDKTLKADHSGCTHGLAVAVNGDEETQWQNSSASVQEWLNVNRSGVYLNVQTEGTWLQHQVNNIQGYNNTKAIEDYNKANADSKVLAVEKIVEYRTSNPAPVNSSNWYLPSAKELSIICGNDVTGNIYGTDNEVGTENRDVINTSLRKVDGATQLGTATLYNYLSSTERSGTTVVNVDFSDGFVTYYGKSNSYHVRPVLAF